MSLLNCLCAAIPARERVVTCEEIFELRVPLPDVVAMQTRQPNLEGAGEIPLRRLVKEARRMRPPGSSSAMCGRRSASTSRTTLKHTPGYMDPMRADECYTQPPHAFPSGR